jgi:GNAT superfamily N-acetyltransferase
MQGKASSAVAERRVGVVVRPLEKSDLDRGLDLWAALLEHGAGHDPRFAAAVNARAAMRDYARSAWLLKDPFPAAWLAEGEHGEPLGFVYGHALYPLPIVAAAPRARIGDVWVVPEARGRGVGRALVRTFIDAAEKRGHTGVEVATLARDPDALAFWRRMGFEDFHVILHRA